MKNVAFLVIAGLLAGGAHLAAAQTTDAERKSVGLEVVLHGTPSDTATADQPFYFRLNLDQKASLRIEADPAKATQPGSSVSCDPTVMKLEPVSTQVDSTVSAAPDGRFTVKLVFADRARAGCRVVNGVSIPVFSNRILESVVTLRDGESTDIELRHPSTSESTKVTVTLKLMNAQ